MRFKKIISPACFILIFSLAACSPLARYNVLSFVFDGVPNPNIDSLQKHDTISQIDSSANIANHQKTKPKINFHPPYLDKECESCHIKSTMGKYTMSQPDLCYQCHENFDDKYAFVHGPVSGGYCTDCHSPHQSQNQKLLARTGQKLCLKCHDRKQVLLNEIHTEIGTSACTECHNPHGGTDRYILN